MLANMRCRGCSDISEECQCVGSIALKHLDPDTPFFTSKVSFYERITKDIAAFAETYAKGKVVSVLEGGYSDLALISASMSHVAGFFPEERSRAHWWQEPTLKQVSDFWLLRYI
jgi:acetoin utilization deacetylase AcuC-like enzyme